MLGHELDPSLGQALLVMAFTPQFMRGSTKVGLRPHKVGLAMSSHV